MEGMHAERKRLLVADRACIEIYLHDGLSLGAIAKEIIHDNSLVSLKVFRNGGWDQHQ